MNDYDYLKQERDELHDILEECRQTGIEVLPPDINRSDVVFTVDEGNVRFGLGAVKNVGRGAIESLIKARKKGGTFKDLYDFCIRVDLKSLNKRMIESLIKAGAMDSFDEQRERLIEGIDQAVEIAQAAVLERESGQFNMFGGSDSDHPGLKAPPLPEVKPWSTLEKLAHEKSVLGFWFSGHPLERYREELAKQLTD